jgi:LytS/YehU family sensor histidine kinase
MYFVLGGLLDWSKHILLWSLLYHVFQYFERSKNNEVERLKLEASVKDFEAKMLRAQLNPHFMFNSLNSIRALVLENPEKAQASVTRLSNLLRNCLVADRQRTVTLGEELKTVQDYLSLEKIRYEDRLNVQTHVNPDTLSVQIPPMMVQTLVENAVKHGISKPLKGGFISIESQREGNFSTWPSATRACWATPTRAASACSTRPSAWASSTARRPPSASSRNLRMWYAPR